MIQRYRDHLRRLRRQYNIFVLPKPVPLHGEAFISENYDRYINITGSVHSQLWLFVLYHEAAHHSLGHVGRISFHPFWTIEYQADMAALEAIRQYQPYAFAKCEDESKTHIRSYLQWYIDQDMWHHIDVGIASWAECDFSQFRGPESDNDNF
jgi:hypothetical protein